MILLDTNVVSELMSPEPDARVQAWAAAQPMETLALSAVSVMEIRHGILRLSDGRRRRDLETRFERFLAQGFAGRVLPFDDAAGRAAAEIRRLRTRLGRPIAIEDGMIAAIAKAEGGIVATRDESGFSGCGVPVVSPWKRKE